MRKKLLSILGVMSVCLVAQAEPVLLDVRPADPANFVDTTGANKSLDIAILTTRVTDGDLTDFDATQIDAESVRFGSGLASPDENYLPTAAQDVDGDGDDDLKLSFAIPLTGIACEDTTVALSGQLYSGNPISGSDTISTPDCPSCHDEPVNYREANDEAFFTAEDSVLQVADAAQSGFNGLAADVTYGSLATTPEGAFSYTPEPDFFGLDSFAYRDGLNNTITVNISVTAVNDFPVARADTISIPHGVAISRSAPGVLANDNDVDGDSVAAILVSNAAYGTLDFGSDGSYSYTPTEEFAGLDSFSYFITDGVAASETVTVNITLPNILLVLADDMGQGDALVYNPDSAIPMPNLTALANAGIRFDNAHATTAACSPTRYSLLTGNYPHRGRRAGGVWKTMDADTMIIPGQQTLGHTLQSADYRTAFFGKLHNGGAFWNEAGTAYTANFDELDFSRPFDRGPTQFGFDYSFLLPGGVGRGPYAYFENDRMVRYDDATGQFTPFDSAAIARLHLQSVTNNQAFNGGLIGISGVAMDNYDSRHAGPILTNRAIAFIDEHLAANRMEGASRPFFLYMALPEPHTPWTPPPVFNAGNPTEVELGMPGTPVANATPVSERTDTVYEADIILGTLLAKLDDEGLLSNTLVIFTSDNGPNSRGTQPGYDGTGERIEAGPGGEHLNAQGVQNGVPLRGFKLQIYEGGHKAPLIMRWGDGTEAGSIIKPGSTSNQLIGSQDMLATLADLTGVQLPGDQANDSVSYSEVLLRNAWRQMRGHMLVQGLAANQDYTMLGRALYNRDDSYDIWKLIVDSDAEDPELNIQFAALYNLTQDPGEANNRLDDPAAAAQLAVMSSEYLDLISRSRTVP